MGQFEWESSNLHISYPFVQPGVPGLNDAFADALVIDTQQGLPVRLASLSISSWTVGGVTMVVQYNDGSAFFSGSPSLQLYTYGDWIVIRQTLDGKEAQLILDTRHSLPIVVSSPIEFVARVQEDDPKSITSIEVDGHTLTGDIELVAGYNIGLQDSAVPSPVRAGAVGFSMEAVPGSGLGVAPNECSPPAYARSINTVAPDVNSNLGIYTKGCYSCCVPPNGACPDPASFDPLPATVQLFNDCGQCCKCTDYENMYKALQRVHARGRNTGLRIARVIDDLSGLLSEVWRQKHIREVPAMNMLLRPSHGYIMGVQINLLNNGVFTSLDMNQAAVEDALATLRVTSSDVDMSGAVVLLKSCYLYNSSYSNPWLHVEPSDIMVNPTGVTSTDVGLIVKSGLHPGRYYELIKTTQYITLFFEIFWKDEVTPEDGDEVTVTLTSDIFKPYTLVKTDTLIKPFDTADPT